MNEKSDEFELGREYERKRIVIFLRNHARFAGFAEMFGGYSNQELLEKKADQIENGYEKLCFDEQYPEEEKELISEQTN